MTVLWCVYRGWIDVFDGSVRACCVFIKIREASIMGGVPTHIQLVMC